MIEDLLTSSEVMEPIKKAKDLMISVSNIWGYQREGGFFQEQEAREILDECRKLVGQLPDIVEPENTDELIQAELKRRLNGEIDYCLGNLEAKHLEINDILNLYAIPKGDFDRIEPWLKEHMNEVEQADKRLCKRYISRGRRFKVSLDVDEIRYEANKVAGNQIDNYWNAIKQLVKRYDKEDILSNLTLKPTNANRSVYNSDFNVVYFAIPLICYALSHNEIKVDKIALIHHFGHEVIGHSLIFNISKNSRLPHFLQSESYITQATIESTGRFYGDMIFHDLEDSPEIQRQLGIEDNFIEIHEEADDVMLKKLYVKMLQLYTIKLLADKTISDTKNQQQAKLKKIAAIKRLSVDKGFAIRNFEKYNPYCDSQGNPMPSILAELRYCADPVGRVLKIFGDNGIDYEGDGRNIIDQTLLTGFWTPIGLEQWARLVAKEYGK